MAAGRKNFIFFLCLLDGVQFSLTARFLFILFHLSSVITVS